ncbi:MAG: NosD domain-containing protein [Candidatus Thorarchaeota archaeon]
MASSPHRQLELGFCEGCKIVNSSFYGQKKRGLFIQDSPNTIVNGSTFEKIGDYVIDMRYSPQSSFCHNSVTETSDIAVFIRDSAECNVSFNDISGNHQEGVWFDGSSGCTVESNTFHSNGINALRLYSSDNCRIANNIVQSNSGWGIRLSSNSDNCLLDNNTISMNGEIGIEIEDSFNCVLTNNTLTLNEEGIHLDGSQNITIINNSIGENSRGGIGIRGSLECVIENNTIDDGVYFHSWSLPYCLHNISGNTMQGKDLGYFVGINDTQIDGSLYGQVILINCMNISVQDGVFDSAMVGVEILHSANCTVIDNEISNPGYFGMFFTNTANCIVTNNSITDGLWYGLHLGGGTNNFSIYNNVVGWNVLWNAWDDGTNNHWNNSMGMGNRWGDYNGTGIYEIRSNFASSYDYHPQKADNDKPTIALISDIDYIEDSTDNVITWIARDPHPKLFIIYSNDTKVHEGVWDGVDIVYAIDGLSLGVYNYSVIVYDTCYNFASESVLILVRDGTPPIVNSHNDISYVVGETGHVIIWNPEDSHPASFAIYLDSLLVTSGPWNSSGEQISFNVDGFAIGLHNITLVLVDDAGNQAVDMVIVEVVNPITSPTITTTTTTTTTTDDEPLDMVVLMIAGAGTGFVILVILLYRKSRP